MDKCISYFTKFHHIIETDIGYHITDLIKAGIGLTITVTSLTNSYIVQYHIQQFISYILDYIRQLSKEDYEKWKLKFLDSSVNISEDITNEIKFQNYLNTTALSKGQLYHSHYNRTHSRPWFYDLPLKSPEIVILNRIRSNHYNLNYSLFRKNIVSSST